jgi:hypothetical protein
MTATNANGTSSASAQSDPVVPAIPATVPNAPTNLAPTIFDSGVSLSWTAPSSDGGSAITDYKVEYKLSSTGVWSVFNDGVSTTPTATITSLSNDNSYDFRVSAINGVGVGSSSASVSATPGAPAQIIVQSFSSLTTPTISTNIRITNEGVSAYEYQYTWCITDSAINLCGGGNDIFSSSAAKLINPGANFDTILNSTVPSAGNYWFHAVVNYGSQSSSAGQSFTALSTSGTADLSSDGIVDIVDFSILMYHWGTSNATADINHDGTVDLADFSIMMYYWNRRYF